MLCIPGRDSAALRDIIKKIKSGASEIYCSVEFSDVELLKLVNSLTRQVQILSLSGVTDNGAVILAGVLEKRNCCIKELQLQKNSITNKGAMALAHVLQKRECKLEKLDLSCNNIGDSGVVALAKAVEKSSLRALDLAYNKFTDSGAASLAAAVKQSCLKRLTIVGNQTISRTTLTSINQTLSLFNSRNFIISSILLTPGVISRTAKRSKICMLPADLIREIMDMLGKNC